MLIIRRRYFDENQYRLNNQWERCPDCLNLLPWPPLSRPPPRAQPIVESSQVVPKNIILKLG